MRRHNRFETYVPLPDPVSLSLILLPFSLSPGLSHLFYSYLSLSYLVPLTSFSYCSLSPGLFHLLFSLPYSRSPLPHFFLLPLLLISSDLSISPLLPVFCLSHLTLPHLSSSFCIVSLSLSGTCLCCLSLTCPSYLYSPVPSLSDRSVVDGASSVPPSADHQVRQQAAGGGGTKWWWSVTVEQGGGGV